MPSVLIVAHAPLASALELLARHTYADFQLGLAAVDIPETADLAQAEAAVSAAVAALPGPEVLLLADAFGATPCNAALAAADGQRQRVVAGVNVPMLWRALCYAERPLEDLVGRAADGGRQGIMQVAAPRRQNQPKPPCSDDPDENPDQ